MLRTIVGRSLGYHFEGDPSSGQHDLLFNREGNFTQLVDNAALVSRYEIRSNCVCVGEGSFKCLALYKDSRGNLRFQSYRSRAIYVTTKRL